MAKRIQRKRTKGWRMPEGAVYVGRPTRWGNPFVVMEATPRPWAFDAKSEEIWSVGKGLVATVKQRGPLVKVASDYRLLETEANGEFIVKAANAHDRLIEALENALTVLTEPWMLGDACEADCECVIEQSRAALALARGEVE